ncbi:MAG TPA: alpha/beta fold hydrolase [Thauera aminoaromatica]|nr:alpha/beta hydrolase [Thauera sp.]HMV94053.1 alpha/beta fold hydrolase [Thauera aminoaromatica]HMY80138.1 alpha/beta fold hydrolase [Thauera aminoaromatica]HMZ30157.1 alpha/beta fold hydrolase [Thauera aminoaromatica]HNB06900.1 alpha/beta fold hydrolase [Thauera aminoaromatica]
MTQTLQLDGRRAAFDESGPAAAPAILLIHGAGHDRGVWQAVTAGLAAAGRRVIVPDLPGHGDSEGEAPGAVDTMAAWVLAFADALGLERFELAGHSMGSLVALAAAAAAPGRIARLHLLGSLAPMPVAPFLLDAARSDPAQAHALINKFSFAPAEVLGEERRRMLEAGNRERMERNRSETLARDLAACNTWQDGLVAAARRDCPTLLLCGALDRMTPIEAIGPLHEALRAGGGEVRLVELAGCGHAMQEEAPTAVVRALLGTD